VSDGGSAGHGTGGVRGPRGPGQAGLILVLNKMFDLRGDRGRAPPAAAACANEPPAGSQAGDVIPACRAPNSGRGPAVTAPARSGDRSSAAASGHGAQQDREEADRRTTFLLQSRRLGDARPERCCRANGGGIAKPLIERYMWIASGVLVVTPCRSSTCFGTPADERQIGDGNRPGSTALRSPGAVPELALSRGRSLAGLGV